MQWRQKRRNSWTSYQKTTCSIASNGGKFAWSGVGIAEGSTLRVTTFLWCNFLNKNVLTLIRLFYSHTAYNFLQPVASHTSCFEVPFQFSVSSHSQGDIHHLPNYSKHSTFPYLLKSLFIKKDSSWFMLFIWQHVRYVKNTIYLIIYFTTLLVTIKIYLLRAGWLVKHKWKRF